MKVRQLCAGPPARDPLQARLAVCAHWSRLPVRAPQVCPHIETGRTAECALHAELFLLPMCALVEKCTSVACGAEFTMWLTEEGRLLSAGLPQYGQLGHGTDNEYNAKDCERPPPPHRDPARALRMAPHPRCRPGRAASVQLKYAAQPTPTAIAKLAHTKIMKFACVRAPRCGMHLAASPAPCPHRALTAGLTGCAGRKPLARTGRQGRCIHLGYAHSYACCAWRGMQAGC